MDQKAEDHTEREPQQTTTHQPQVLHLTDLPSYQEQNSHRSIPVKSIQIHSAYLAWWLFTMCNRSVKRRIEATIETVLSSCKIILSGNAPRVLDRITVKYLSCYYSLYLMSQLSSPDDNAHQSHDGFVQAVEEVAQRPSLLPHPAQHEAEGCGEHHQAQSIDPTAGARCGHQRAIAALITSFVLKKNTKMS